MQTFFKTIFPNIGKVFSGKNLFWHGLAIILTYLLVVSDFDWFWFLSTRSPVLQSLLFPAIIVGMLLPMFGPILIILTGILIKNKKTEITGWALGQAALLGWFTSSVYKAFTGRIQPNSDNLLLNISHNFQLGFMKHGIFWGWPSSHTAVSFALMVSLIMLFPEKKWVKYPALAYALYVGLSVSTNIHWFSDFLAGAVIGSVIGVVVGKRFFLHLLTLKKKL